MRPTPSTPTRRLPLSAVAIVLGVLAGAGGAAIARGSDDAPDRLRDALGILTGKASPDGANDFACRPREPHPRPVVLVHGTFSNMHVTWKRLSPRLAAAGYCVFALNYGDTSHGRSPLKAVGPVAASAKELARFVAAVRAATGAHTVDVVGYSQGGLVARQYLRFEGGAERVHALVALAPSNRGTKTVAAEIAKRFAVSLRLITRACPACADQMWDSNLVRRLNSATMTLPGIGYTVISTTRDGVVRPWRSQQLPPGPGVRNITLQEVCADNRATHMSLPSDALALREVEHALDPAHVPAPGGC
jgi:pimeloyl-ACP methyl ester carboxylesterase